MTMTDLTGRTLGQYDLRELIGAGGMGAVYRAYQRNLERAVAVKVLSTQLASETGYVERFYREAKTSAALEHANIIPVYDYGMQREYSYVVMRLLTGGTLAERMKRREERSMPLPALREVADLLRQLAGALDYAHSQGVIHRDIKPSNIMFDNQGNAYLVDFGIAKLMEATHALTGTGTTMGTPSFMPPEQWRSEPLTPAADQYALATTIYALLVGRVPYEATTPFGLMHKHLHEKPTPPHHERAELPETLSIVMERALAKSAGDRFPTVTAFYQAFEAATAGTVMERTGFLTMSLPTTPPPAPLTVTMEPPAPEAAAPPRQPSTARAAQTPSSGSAQEAPTMPPEPAVAHAGMISMPALPSSGPVPTARKGHRGVIALAALVIVVAVSIGSVLLLGGGDQGDSTPATGTENGAVAMSGDAHTPTITMSPSDTPAPLIVTATARPTATSTPSVPPTEPPSLTPEPTEAPTDPPSLTPEPTARPTAAPTATPQAVAAAPEGTALAVISNMGALLRVAPAFDATHVDIATDTTLEIVGRTEDNIWLLVNYEGRELWIRKSGFVLIEGELDAVSVITPHAAVAIITNMGATLRLAPGFDAETVTTISETTLDIVGRTENNVWLLVNYEGRELWMRKSGFVLIEGELDAVPVITPHAAVAIITSMGATLRLAPGFDAETVTTISETTLDIVGRTENNVWLLVNYEGRELWMRKSGFVLIEGELDAVPVVEPAASGAVVAVVGSMASTLRDSPDFNGAAVDVVHDITLDVLGRSADGVWLLVRFNNRESWLRRSAFVTIEGDLDTVPVITPGASQDSAVVAVVGSMASTLRDSPDFNGAAVDVVHDITLDVLGRSADGVWLLVRFNNRESWLRRSAFVTIEGDLDTVPVITPGAPQDSAVIAVVGSMASTLRDSPDFNGAAVDVVHDITLDVLGRSADGVWLLVRFNNRESWLRRSAFVTIEGDLDTVPLITPGAPQDSAVAVVNRMGAVLHDGPSFGAAIIDVITDVTVDILGRSADGVWLLVNYDGRELWLRKSTFVTVEGDLDTVPVIASAAPQDSAVVAVVNRMGAVLHDEPSFGAAIIDVITDVTVDILGRSEDGVWLLVNYDGRELWLRKSAFVTVEGDLDTVPVIR